MTDSIGKNRQPQKDFDSALKKSNYRVKKVLDSAVISESLRSIESCYHTDPTTHYNRVKRDFEGLEIKLPVGAPILDLGCSIGATTIALSNIYPENPVFGIDISPVRIRIAVEKTAKEALDGFVSVYSKSLGCMVHEYIENYKQIRMPKQFIVADGFKPPFADNSFAAVFCMHNVYYTIDRLNDTTLKALLMPILRLVSDESYLMMSGSGRNTDCESVAFKKNAGSFSLTYANFMIDSGESKIRLGRLLNILRTGS